MTATPGQRERVVWRDLARTAVVLAAVWLATLAVPDAQIAIVSPSLRVALETLRLCVVGLAALVLALPHDQHGSVVRSAFVAALTVIAASSALLGVLPNIVGETTGAFMAPPDPFYPWLASRYVAGALFVSAAVQWPRARMRVYVMVALAAFIALGAALTAVMPPIDDTAARTAMWMVSLELPPLVLFAFGAWLAARHAAADGSALERWLALSLLVGVFTQLQAIRQPDVLGPLVTGTDLLRMISTALLLVGATAQVRQMSRDRVRVMRMQRHELDERDAMVRELARYVSREETFRAVVHHELSTPVATIRAYAHVLGHVDAEDGRWRDALAGLIAEAARLHELIGRIDELRALESADLRCTLRPVRALPLLQDLARYTRALPGPHHVEVRADDVRILADPVRIGQALRNVATNAVRYSPDGGRITMIGEVAGDDRYHLAVVDEGIGIDPDAVGTLLAYAGRGDNVATIDGSGIGLYVARRVAEAHDGRLSIEPNLPAGTRVTIEVGCA
ncbi:MAG TPA: HAMP domain-containing sensor histidine kinase [Euzebyales bacterium]